jgi:hypothetical protein
MVLKTGKNAPGSDAVGTLGEAVILPKENHEHTPKPPEMTGQERGRQPA